MLETQEHKSGTFIAVEGQDGVGKSIFVQELVDHATKIYPDREIIHCVSPQKGLLRDYLLEIREVNIPHLSELFVLLAAHIEQVQNKILPALKRGAVVICDRYIDSFLAYQGFGRDLNEAFEMYRRYLDIYQPHIWIYLVSPKEVIEERLKNRIKSDRIDLEKEEFVQKVRQGYKTLMLSHVKKDSSSIVVMLNDGSVQQLRERSQKWLEDFLYVRNFIG